MTAGLQVWDANGVLVLDITTRLTRLVGSLDTGTSNGSFALPDHSGDPFIMVEGEVRIFNRSGPGIWLDGRVVRWAFDDTFAVPRASYKIRYGYY